MTFDNKIYIQHKIIKRIKLLFISSNIREDIESYNKKENKRKNTIDYRDKTNIKKRHSRKSRIKILKKIMNILKR